jgi:hypothetical protein
MATVRPGLGGVESTTKEVALRQADPTQGQRVYSLDVCLVDKPYRILGIVQRIE